MLKLLAIVMALAIGSTAAWADARSECSDWKNTPPDRLIIMCTEVIGVDAKNAVAFGNRGIAYSAKGDKDRAIVDYTKAIELDPYHSAIAYDNRGKIYWAKGDYDLAIADHSKAIEMDQKDDVAFDNRGHAYQSRGDFDRAIADYAMSIKLNPKSDVAYDNRCGAYRSKGDLDRAIADCNKAIELNPNGTIAHANRGLAYASKGDNDRAISDFTTAIEMDPKFVFAYHNRAVAFFNKGNNERAITDLTIVIEIDPQNAEAYSDRAGGNINTGDTEHAIIDATRAIELNSNLASAYTNRAAAFVKQGKYDRGIADADKAIGLLPMNAMAYNVRGSAYTGKGELKRAASDYDRAIELVPSYAEALVNRDAVNRALADASLTTAGKKKARQSPSNDDGICPPCGHPDEEQLYREITEITQSTVVIITKRNTRNSTAARIVVDIEGGGRGCSWAPKVAAQLKAIGRVIAANATALELPHLQYNIFKLNGNKERDDDALPSNRIIRVSDLVDTAKGNEPAMSLLAHGRMIDAGDAATELCLPKMQNGSEGESWEDMYGTPDPRPEVARRLLPVFLCMDNATSYADRMACLALSR